MAGRVYPFGQTTSRTVAAALVLLVLLQSTLVWEEITAAPAKRDDILAGTEFLSVFINGAMAQKPIRRRGSRRGSAGLAGDHVAAESQHQEASIYRISRTSKTSTPRQLPQKPGGNSRDEGIRFYPISQKSLDNSPSLTSLIDDLSTASDFGSMLTPRTDPPSSEQTGEPINQKVIGVSVTSTVEATPYKVRVEHYVGDEMTTLAESPTTKPVATTEIASTTLQETTTSVTFVTPLPALQVTEELSNIVSESNRSEFTVDEGSPRTSWRNRAKTTTQRPVGSWHTSHPMHRHHRKEMSDSVELEELNEQIERNREIEEGNSETGAPREEPSAPTEPTRHFHQGRKTGRHYETMLYGQTGKANNNSPRVYSEPSKVYGEPEKVYGEPAKVYSEPARMYGEPAKVYGEPARVYSEPAKVYGEPEKVYSEPSKIYSEPSKVYSEPAKVYSEPSRVYSEPAKIYGMDGRPIKTPKTPRNPNPSEEPEEQNYEVDEAVSVGSNGNVHGPQMITESPGVQDPDDGHKVGYVVEGRNYRKYRVEERTPDGFIVGEYGVVSHDDGSLRGVRYTADGNINPRLIHDTLMKFLAL